jgi:hypothetical protein
MGSFQRAFLGYRRPEVDAAIQAREIMIADLKRECAAKVELETELHSLSAMVIEREREIRGLHEQLREVSRRHEQGLASLESLTARLLEIEAQARGQATRIRMKALREAVEVARRSRELSEAEAAAVAGTETTEPEAQEVFEGRVRMEIGPLGDYSQLVGLEDAIDGLGASEISIERFSEGRATLSMQLDEPVALLRELEEHAPLEFKVRRNGDEGLILDVDEDSGSERAA